MNTEELDHYYGQQVWTTYQFKPCLVTLHHPLTEEKDYYWVDIEEDNWLEPPSNIFLTKEEAKEAALKEIEKEIDKLNKLKQEVLDD